VEQGAHQCFADMTATSIRRQVLAVPSDRIFPRFSGILPQIEVARTAEMELIALQHVETKWVD